MRSILWKTVANVLTSAGISALAAAILVVPDTGSRTFAATGPGTTNTRLGGGPLTCKNTGGRCTTFCAPNILSTRCTPTGANARCHKAASCTGCQCLKDNLFPNTKKVTACKCK